MKAILGVHSDRVAADVAVYAFGVASELIRLLDAPVPGEEGSSLLAEFDDSPQGVADAVLGRGQVLVPGDIEEIGKEFL
jgi:hypothetical protein